MIKFLIGMGCGMAIGPRYPDAGIRDAPRFWRVGVVAPRYGLPRR